MAPGSLLASPTAVDTTCGAPGTVEEVEGGGGGGWRDTPPTSDPVGEDLAAPPVASGTLEVAAPEVRCAELGLGLVRACWGRALSGAAPALLSASLLRNKKDASPTISRLTCGNDFGDFESRVGRF